MTDQQQTLNRALTCLRLEVSGDIVDHLQFLADAAVAEARMKEFHAHDNLREVNRVLVAQLAEAVKDYEHELDIVAIRQAQAEQRVAGRLDYTSVQIDRDSLIRARAALTPPPSAPREQP